MFRLPLSLKFTLQALLLSYSELDQNRQPPVSSLRASLREGGLSMALFH